ncbi:MAG: AAA domain-containing protein, partial [Lewinella sp.]|nr:AAA domain-containing protein [Lewinella sp.]
METKQQTTGPTKTPQPTGLRQRVAALLAALGAGLYERQQAVHLAFLTAVAGESIFLLGPPGVGKSLIARRLKFAFADGNSFEFLMSKFTTPDEIFGPISIKKLKEEDAYERLTDRYLPGAHVVFLDEIWKAGPAIQNALLTILNEKIYRNGAHDLDVKIRGIITASNELPPRNQSLEPIWDRFLLRLELGKIKQFDNFLGMITNTGDLYADPVAAELKLSEAELQGWSALIDAVVVPPEVLNTIQLVNLRLEEYNAQPNHAERQINIYDRRWKKIVRLLRTAAFLNGRTQVNLMDCFLCEHCLWNSPEQREVVREILVEAIRHHGYSLAVNLSGIKREVADFGAEVKAETQVIYTTTSEQLRPVQEIYYALETGDGEFKGRYMSIEQFRQLHTTDYRSSNFYDEEFKLISKILTRQGPRENSIEVNYNGREQIFPLLTQGKEQQEVIARKPHSLLARHWDERLERLQIYLQEQTERLNSQAPAALAGLQDNLFVAPELAEVVLANQREVQAALQQLSLQLEKIHFAYGS